MKLQNQCILVTRPPPQGEILCDKIREQGGKPIYLPTLDIVPPPDVSLFHQHIAHLDQFDWIIFISPQAVLMAASEIHHQWSVFPTRVKVAAMGAGTAFALQEARLPVTIYPQDDWSAAGLLELPEFQQAMHDKKIAVICGVGGRELLVDTLVQRGAHVTSIIAYQRQLPKIDASKYIHLFHERTIDIIVCTSNESLQNLVTLMGEGVRQILFQVLLVVVSERNATYAKEVGFKKVIIAGNASHEAIMTAIQHC
jgi:uroporphyrinogen-III synthase